MEGERKGEAITSHPLSLLPVGSLVVAFYPKILSVPLATPPPRGHPTVALAYTGKSGICALVTSLPLCLLVPWVIVVFFVANL